MRGYQELALPSVASGAGPGAATQTRGGRARRRGPARLGSSSRGGCRTTCPNPQNPAVASRLPSRLRGREIAAGKAVSALSVWLMFLQHLKKNQEKKQICERI